GEDRSPARGDRPASTGRRPGRGRAAGVRIYRGGRGSARPAIERAARGGPGAVPVNEEALARLLGDVRAGRLDVDAGLAQLPWLPLAELGLAKVATHRLIRRRAAEAVYCPGKTVDQILRITEELRRSGAVVLLTRADPALAEQVVRALPEARH